MFGYMIKFERNQALEFLPPKKEIKFNHTDSSVKLMLYETLHNRRPGTFG